MLFRINAVCSNECEHSVNVCRMKGDFKKHAEEKFSPAEKSDVLATPKLSLRSAQVKFRPSDEVEVEICPRQISILI